MIREFYSGDSPIVGVGDNRSRKDEAACHKGPFGVAIHPRAIVSPSARIGEGSVVMAGAVIQTGAVIGKHAIVNSNSIVEHHCVLKDFAHVAPRAILLGGARIGEGALIGAGAIVIQGVIVPEWWVVKAGSICKNSNASSEDQFWAKVERMEEACWLWRGFINQNGYGVAGYKRRNFLAHRLSWILTYGEIPEGLYVCHKCDTPACVRPDHLFVGSQLENMRDMHSKGRHKSGFKKGMNRGEKNGQAKLSAEMVAQIRQRLATGDKPGVIAADFGVSRRCISAIKTGLSWGWV